MEEPREVATEGDSSRNRNPTRKRKAQPHSHTEQEPRKRLKPSPTNKSTSTTQPNTEDKPSLVPVRRSSRLLEKRKQQKEQLVSQSTKSASFSRSARPREARSSGQLREDQADRESISTPRRSARIRSVSSLAESPDKGSTPSSSSAHQTTRRTLSRASSSSRPEPQGQGSSSSPTPHRVTRRKRPRATSPTSSPSQTTSPSTSCSKTKRGATRVRTRKTAAVKAKAKTAKPTVSSCSASSSLPTDQEEKASRARLKSGSSSTTSLAKRKRNVGQRRRRQQPVKSASESEAEKESLPTAPARKKRKTAAEEPKGSEGTPPQGRRPSAARKGKRQKPRSEQGDSESTTKVSKKKVTSPKGKGTDSDQVDSAPRSKAKVRSRRNLSESQPSRGKGKGIVSEEKELGASKERSKGKGKGQGSSLKGKGRASLINSSSSGLHCYALSPFAMSANSDQQVPTEDQGNSAPRQQAEGGFQGAEGEPKPFDPFVSMNEEGKKLQAMLESRNLPPHLLGALGSKMHFLLQKSMSSSISSSNNSRAQELLAGIESMDDETIQLQSCIEMGQLLVMGNEDTLSGFPVKQAVPALINLLAMEHNFDMMVNACRALTYMMEALPRTTVVVATAIPVLIEKLQVIQCMDVAEQALSALEVLSRRHGKAILQAGGLNACLLYLDFFSIATQRCALSVAANCCQSAIEGDFPLFADAVPILSTRLQHQDKRCVESCCLCFSRLVDSFSNDPKILQEIAGQGLLPNLQHLLVVSPPVISPSMFVQVVRLLSTLCASCPVLAVELLKLNMAETLKYLLVGSGEITLENIELMSRSPNEVYEILCLACELLPPLPKDGIFEVEAMMKARRHSPTTVQWEWQEKEGSWRPYGRMENRIIEAAHQSQEEECSVAIMGNVYIVDFGAMQQINEDTGTARCVRRTTVDPLQASTEGQEGLGQSEEDARMLALLAEPALGASFVQSLFAILYEVFNSMAGSAVRNKCLRTMLRTLYHTDPDVLVDILRDISVSSHIATMLKSQDYRTVVGALQMADILIQKLPDIFTVYFHREGVMHQIKTLRDVPLKMLATPRKDVGVVSSPLPHPLATPDSPQTPTSTRRRLTDIFRKGRKHFRRTLSRGRSDDELQTRTQAPPTPPRSTSTSGATATPPTAAVGGARDVEKPPEGAEGVVSLPKTPKTPKESIQEWIQKQASGFVERWSEAAEKNPALEVVKRLQEASEQLEVDSLESMEALRTICEVLMDPTANISAFEFIHADLNSKLMTFLTESNSDTQLPLNTRLRHFTHIFLGLPDHDSSLVDWTPSAQQVGLVSLLQMLHKCINQLEQLPVKVHDLPGRRGSQALRFFNSHQIKCTLERHPCATSTSQWKGGPVRIDPLATVQTLERYMMVRGFGRPDHARRFEDIDMADDEFEDMLVLNLQGNTHRHCIEFLINDHVLPYSMTIFQAVKQYAFVMGSDGDEEGMPLGRPEIWIHSHTIQYRTLPPSPTESFHRAGPSFARSLSSSLPATPISDTPPTSGRKATWSGDGGGPHTRRRAGSSKFLPPSSMPPPTRVTRLSSKEKLPLLPPRIVPPSLSGTAMTPPRGHAHRPPRAYSLMGAQDQQRGTVSPQQPASKPELHREEKVKLPPLHQALQQSVTIELSPGDPSMPVIRLVKVLYALNTHWTDLYQGLAGNPVVPLSEFTNSNLTAKATRQVQDPLNVMTGNFPRWLTDLVKCCPFLFPFECRQMLFYLTTFDRDRAIARLQEQQPELSTSEASQTVTPRFDKKKRCVAREDLLEQAEKLMNDLASNRALLEISYQDEVGTGLGPTLEFYALVSRELQRSDLFMWRGDPCPMPGAPQGASSTPQYVQSPVGLFPLPMGPSTRFSVVEEVCSKFRFLGKFVAKAIMDSRMLDLPFSEAFYKWMLGQERTFTAQDLQHVDPIVARSFAQLAAVAVKKHTLESDPLLSGKALAVGIESLTLDGGGTIEDLDLDFTLPGCPELELRPGGKEIPVTIHNLDDYLKLVVDWTLIRGVGRQMEAFKEGFNSVFPISSLQGFYPAEMDMLLCGAHHQKWDIKELMDHCRPDHGYSHDSRAIQFLFEVLSTYDNTEQRQFMQFVTGSPRLPVGGFRALNPALTIVRKTVESPKNPDEFLPSVMTCVNYLKLPDYSSPEVMRERLHFALLEGKYSFHLS